MEQTLQDKTMKCVKHQDNNIIYLKINDFQENSNIFYCEICVNRDFNFKPQNFVRIKEILDYSNQSIIFNWPPLNNHSIQQQIVEFFEQNESINEVLKNKIISYFNNLKNQINSKIEECQNSLLKYIQSIPSEENSIKQKYQDISNGNHLKKIIIDNISTQAESEKQCKLFIQEFIQKKEENTKIFENIINKNKQLSSAVDFKSLNKIEQQILSNFDQINGLLSKAPSFKEEQSQNGDFLTSLDFIKSKHDPKYQNLSIERDTNQQIFLRIQSSELGYGTYYYSNKILEKDRKYQLKIKVTNSDLEIAARFGFGLCRDELKDSTFLLQDNLFFHANLSQKSLTPTNLTSNIIKLVKGDFKSLQKQIELDVVISLGEEIFQITDTNKHFEVTIQDEFKKNLSQYQNLRLYVLLDTFIEVQIIQAKEL